MLIGLPIAILYFLARKITAEDAEERRAFNRLLPLRVPLRTLRLNSRFGYSISHVPDSSCIVKSPDSGFGYLSSYVRFRLGRGLAADPCNGSRATDIFKYSEIQNNLCDSVYWQRRHGSAWKRRAFRFNAAMLAVASTDHSW